MGRQPRSSARRAGTRPLHCPVPVKLHTHAHANPQKTDPTGAYVRKWLPTLRGLPPAYIYEPWKAPKDVLRVRLACGSRRCGGRGRGRASHDSPLTLRIAFPVARQAAGVELGVNYPRRIVEHDAVSRRACRWP